MPRLTQAGLAKPPGSSRRVSDSHGRAQSRMVCDMGRVLRKLYSDPACRDKRRPGRYRPQCEQLESRQLLSPLPLNEPLTTDPGVQQMPAVAVDPHDPAHLAVAYM